MKISNEVKVGLTILAAIIAGFLGYRVMRDLPLFRQSTVVHTFFSKTDGLSPGSYIYINGVKVGSVKGMDLTNGDSVEVGMSFNLGVEIPEDSKAYLRSSGLLDGKAIVVERGHSSKMVAYGDTLPGFYSKGIMETFKKEGKNISNDLSQSFEKLNKLLTQLNNTVDDTASNKIDNTLNNLESTTRQISTMLRRKKSDLEASITHAHQFLANVDTVSMHNKSRIDSVMKNLDKSMDQLQVLSRDLNETNAQLSQILTKINEGKGSLGKLVNDPGLYENLDKMTEQMNALIKNINDDPGKYLKNMHLIEVF